MPENSGTTRSTELFDAIAAGDTARVTGLIHQDQALASARNDRNVSPLLFALYNRNPDMAELLRAHVEEVDAFEAAALGDTDRLAQMIDGNTIKVEAQSADGFTMLHLAAFFDRADTVRMLLKSGADPDAVASNGSLLRPIHSAAAAGSAEIVELLLDAGADPNASQHGGWTALHAAAKHNLTEMVRILVRSDADPNQQADDGDTPIDLARNAGNHDILALLAAE